MLLILFCCWLLQSLEELRDFMYVDSRPTKDRQKLMRNLRVRKHEAITALSVVFKIVSAEVCCYVVYFFML
jgi:hypothetical protein